jgi:hypothetical protein
MNTIAVGDQQFTAPSNWNELTVRQLVIWGKLLEKEITIQDAQMVASIFFYGIPKRLFFKLNPVQQHQIAQTLNFLAGQNKLVMWMFPSLKVRFRNYLGPENRLSSSTIKEFRFAEKYYSTFKKSKDEKFLDLLIATLFRPRGFNQSGIDFRETLNDIGIRQRAGKMQHIKDPIRKAILFNYEGCRLYVFGKYPNVFKPGPPGAGAALPDLEGLLKVVAGGKFGSFNETEQTPLYLFLDHLSDEIEESEKQKS